MTPPTPSRTNAAHLARLTLAAFALAPFAHLVACTQVEQTARRPRPDAGDLSEYEKPDRKRNKLPLPGVNDYVNEDAGVFGPGDRPAPVNAPKPDAEVSEFPYEPCETPMGPGDLAIVEMMVQSAPGSGDKGEWIELRNMRDCALDVTGVHVTSPRGALMDRATIIGPLFLPAGDKLIVATHENGGVTGPLSDDVIVVLFGDDLTDVLKNDGDTITVTLGETVIDTLTYPRFEGFQIGRSIAFPLGCAWAERSNWARWSYSSAAWTDTRKATPGRDNDDIACY